MPPDTSEKDFEVAIEAALCSDPAKNQRTVRGFLPGGYGHEETRHRSLLHILRRIRDAHPRPEFRLHLLELIVRETGVHGRHVVL